MSVNVKRRMIHPGDGAFMEEAWALKERVQDEEGVLKQQRGFFTRAYRRSTVYVYVNPEEDEFIGFAATRSDGYILFLAVAPEYRGHGFGQQLVAEVADRTDRISCHARTTNKNALGFYDHLGFEIVRQIDNYYEDGGDAYYLQIGEKQGILDKLSSLLRR